MERIRAQLAELTARFQGLSERERRLIVGLAVTAVLFVVFFVFLGFSQGAASTRRRIAAKSERLEAVQMLAGSYAEADRARRNVERQLQAAERAPLLSYIEQRGSAAGLEIPSMNPRGETPLGDGRIVETSVELTLTDQTLPTIHRFLTSLEQGPGVVKVKYLRLEPDTARGVATAWVTVSAYSLRGS